jgi:hypothetical protein
MVGL